MAQKQTRGIQGVNARHVLVPAVLFLLPLCFLVVLFDMVTRSMNAREAYDTAQQATVYLTNDGLQQFVTDFFIQYDAAEMIPIIACESRFRHFDDDGSVLMNTQGSSATGIAQIMASVHPDPHVIKRYNRRHHTNFKAEDFDISTLSGNLWYALVLYKTNGTRDWECAKLL